MPAKKYFEGMMLGPNNNILFIKELNYVNGRKKGIFKCPICEREDWEAGLADITSGRSSQCKHCSGKKDSEKFIKLNQSRIKDLTGQTFGKLTVLEHLNQKDKKGRYLNKCQCSCNNKTIMFVNNTDLLTSRILHCGCESSSSLGEVKIMQVLDKLNIKYKKEYSFEDCKNDLTDRKLRFDFYLPDYNICIEFDGKQHFDKNSLFFQQNKLDSFENRKHRDDIKNKYCKNNNIRLIRIPYYDYNKLNEEYLLSLINW